MAHVNVEIHDIEAADEPAICTVIMNNGEECGREKPCRYHDDGGNE